MTDPDEASERDAALDYPDTLRFTLATGEEQFDAAITDVEAATSGAEAGTEAVRAFDSVADLRELLTDRRLEALRSIHADPPDSISALAERLERPYAVVHEDVRTLERHGVVHFADGPRGAKRPFVPYESVRVDVPLVGDTGVPDSIGLRG
jgi:predicted transcriptional regulator